MVFKPNFHDVSRAQSKASIVIQGLSGSGKSGLALILGYTLASDDWSKVYALDSENKSLNLFQGLSSSLGTSFGVFKKFDLLGVHGYKPTNYVASKEAAKEMGAEVFIQDSITHAWTGKKGVLQLVTELEQANATVHKFSAWGQPEVIEQRDAIYEMIRDPEIHMISTVRVKEKFEVITGEGIKSLGVQQIQMPDLKYEPDLVLDMVEAGTTSGRPPKARVIKSRYAILEPDEVYSFDEELCQQIKVYLEEGIDPADLLEQQRQDFISIAKNILDSSSSKRTLWAALKAQNGLEDTPIDEMTLPVLRELLMSIA